MNEAAQYTLFRDNRVYPWALTACAVTLKTGVLIVSFLRGKCLTTRTFSVECAPLNVGG